MSNKAYNFKTGDQLPFNLEDSFIGNNSRGQRLQNTMIICNLEYNVTVMDSNGIIVNIKNRVIPTDILFDMGISSDYKGVIVVETKYLNSTTDVLSTTEYYERIRSIVTYTDKSTEINHIFINSKKSFKKYYTIYTISSRDLRLNESIFLRGPNIVVSTKGKERISPLCTIKDLTYLSSRNNGNRAEMQYFSKTDKVIYYNILGVVHKLNSISTTDTAETVVMNVSDGYTSSTVVIKYNEFSSRGLFHTELEAINSMDNEQMLNNKRLKLEMTKIESGMVLDGIRFKHELDKVKLDYYDKAIKIKMEVSKQRMALVKNNNSGGSPLIKLFSDSISMMIKKL